LNIGKNGICLLLEKTAETGRIGSTDDIKETNWPQEKG
jgi:hypothetical protein